MLEEIRLDKIGYNLLLRLVEAWQAYVNDNLAPTDHWVFRRVDFNAEPHSIDRELREHCRMLQIIGEELRPENYEGIPDIRFPLDHHLAQGDKFHDLLCERAGLPTSPYTNERSALKKFFHEDYDKRSR